MDREGFKNRMSLYREARAVLPLLSYWEWRQKYDAAPKPDAMPDQPLADTPTLQVEPAEDRAHRWDNLNNSEIEFVQFPDADRHRTWKEPKQRVTIKRKPGTKPRFTYRDFMKPADIKRMNFLKTLGKMGKFLRGGSMLGEVVLQLFPSEEAETYENWRSWAEKQNRQMTGLEPLPVYAQGGVTENGEDEKETAILTQEEYIAQQIAAKRAAALDKSRNRTSIRVPMINNPQSEEQWKKSMDERIRITEEQLSKSMATGDLEMAEFLQSALDNLLNQKYIPVVAGFNCMYNAGDCYGLNIPSNQVFAAKHKELGFEKADKDNLEPGDLVQDIKGRTPVHAMIYDSKDSEGNLLFNYAKGHTDSLADDMGYNYAKRGKYPMKNYDVYKYVGTPADSTQWINDYKKLYGYEDGGEVELDPLEVLERSRPKINGIPINDKPLSGTDPLGEAYVNLVSGNAIRKIITKGINRMVRKSFYDAYKDLLKAGFSRNKAYNYASPEIGVDILPGIAKGFDYTIKGANYIHAAENIIEQ